MFYKKLHHISRNNTIGRSVECLTKDFRECQSGRKLLQKKKSNENDEQAK